MVLRSRLAGLALWAMVAAGSPLALGGCSFIQGVIGSFGSGSAQQANSVAAAQSLYTAADTAATAYLQNSKPNAAVAAKIASLDNTCYTELVNLRQAAQAGNSVTMQAGLDAFNAAWAALETYLAGQGVTVPPGTGG